MHKIKDSDGHAFAFERTVELKPGQYVDGKMSQDLKDVVEKNGADDVIWTQGDRVFLSSTRVDNGSLPRSFANNHTLKLGDIEGEIREVFKQDNTKEDYRRANRDKQPACVPIKTKKSDLDDGDKEKSILNTSLGVIGGFSAGLAAQIVAEAAMANRPTVMVYGYRSIKAVPAAAPKLAGAITKHPMSVVIGAAVAVGGLALAGSLLHARFKGSENKNCEGFSKDPDYDMANQVGTPIKD